MTPHNHRTRVEGCYRCELSDDELREDLEAVLTDRNELLDDFLDAIRSAEGGGYERGIDPMAAAMGCMDALEARWPDHFVILSEDRWTVEHSMACRLSGTMDECHYHQAVANVMDGVPPPEDWGRWRITDIDSEGCPSLERVDGGVKPT